MGYGLKSRLRLEQLKVGDATSSDYLSYKLSSLLTGFPGPSGFTLNDSVFPRTLRPLLGLLTYALETDLNARYRALYRLR